MEIKNEKNGMSIDMNEAEKSDEIFRLRKELARAYRALFGLYNKAWMGETPDTAMIAYHSLTIGAAFRYIDNESVEGGDYFIGKPVDVLHETMGDKSWNNR